LRQTPCRYFVIDGGSGAHVLAALLERHPYARQVASPRHANLLLVIEPTSQKLSAAIVELARSLPRPARALIVGEPEAGYDSASETDRFRLEDLLPGARRIIPTSVASVLEAILNPAKSTELAVIDQPGVDETTIQLPQKQEQELATELVVLSLGPVQPFTAGPLRLLLICDGEQVFSARVEAGYAYRGIAQSMTRLDWQHALHSARRLDPLAPVAAQLAYVNAIEQLQRWQSPPQTLNLREAAVALERVENVLWWLVRFANVLDDPALTTRSYRLATRFADHLSYFFRQAPSTWILPQYTVSTPVIAGNTATITHLGQLAGEVEALKRHLERSRLFALRARGIGVLKIESLVAAGVSGPVLQASQHGAGDIQSRLVERLEAAIRDLHSAVETLAAGASAPVRAANWEVPAGMAHVTVRGPRGDIGLHLESSGAAKPAGVEWLRPSAALLPLLPEMLQGQKLADVEALVASLDLAMAEADG
jgi:NADH-quinone oxidoreductase subunit D